MLAENSVLPVGAPLLLVEDEPLLRERLQRILVQLEYPPSAISHAGTLAEARAAMARQCPAVALVDLGLPDGSGLELIRDLFQADPAMLIMVVSAWRSEEAILEALRAGASGYVLKERDDMEVGIAIRNLLNGGAPIDPFMARRLMQEFLGRSDAPAAAQPSNGPLSPREMQVLRMVASGLGNREIAEQLHLSRHTVEQHIKNIYRKLTVTSRTKAVHAARAAGWLD